MRRTIRLLIILGFCMALFAALGGQSPIKSDETIVFFPTHAHRDADGWRVPIHGWVFEPEKDSRVRQETMETLGRLLGFSAKETESELFRARAGGFLVDNERGKEMVIRIGDATFPAGTSEANGHFRNELTLKSELVDKHAQKGDDGVRWLPFQAELRRGDKRVFSGRVVLIDPKGLSVISDIDDTIKKTEVGDKRAVLRNTFLKEFEPVAGMPALYADYRKQGAVFHYISASPWQLYEPLAEFIRKHGYPPGTFHLKDFRLTDRSVLSLFGTQTEYKTPLIERLFTTFPERRFILVGDSGEQDPEIYGAVARKFPKQIASILIRDVTNEPVAGERYLAAFRGVLPEKWRVFKSDQSPKR